MQQLFSSKVSAYPLTARTKSNQYNWDIKKYIPYIHSQLFEGFDK
jgi:hypothetical protein